MDAMTIPDVWSGQDRMLTVEDMENMPDDEFRYEPPELVVEVATSSRRVTMRVPSSSFPTPTHHEGPGRATSNQHRSS